MNTTPQPPDPSQHNNSGPTPYPIWQQRTMPYPVVVPSSLSTLPDSDDLQIQLSTTPVRKKLRIERIVAIVLLLVLAVAFYVIWNSSSITISNGPSQQNSNIITIATSSTSTSTNTTLSDSTGGTIAVYITGEVQHPGVYTLPADARVYQLLQAAGGPLPDANLVALNLASKLSDGEEVYVSKIGETAPAVDTSVTGSNGSTGTNSGSSSGTTSGQLVNINTASTTELRQQLHVSSTTAQNIVNFRLQHGPYTSVDQLLQVVSKSIYNRIKGMVTVS